MSVLSDKEIWVLEDDKGCLFVYEQTLDHRYVTRYFETLDLFSKALEKVAASSESGPALIIADLMLSDGNFLNFLANTENTKLLTMPFIVVSSIDDIDALRFCFREGALDYLTKPFKKNELLVKIENVISGSTKTRVSDQASKSIEIGGVNITNLTVKQIQLLNLFLKSEDRSISRQDILEKVWGDTTVHPKTVDVHLYNLRRKLHGYGFLIRSDGGGRWSLMADRY